MVYLEQGVTVRALCASMLVVPWEGEYSKGLTFLLAFPWPPALQVAKVT